MPHYKPILPTQMYPTSNNCYQNRLAETGIRMEGTAPVVEDNECCENEMAGMELSH